METKTKLNIDTIELFSNWVLIANPIRVEIDYDKLGKMPKAHQEKFMQDQLAEIKNKEDAFYSCEVLKAGCDCTKVSVGDNVFLTTAIAANGTFLDDTHYILLRENNILGINVGQKENI